MTTSRVGSTRGFGRSTLRLAAPRNAAVLAALLLAGCGSPHAELWDRESAAEPGGDSAAGADRGGDAGADSDAGVLDLPAAPPIDPVVACASEVLQAARLPVNLLLTIDTSGSMIQAGKWSQTKQALLAFFHDPGTQNMRVALRFWPEGVCNESTCDAVSCSSVRVALGPLSSAEQREALSSSFTGRVPVGETNMSAALGGAELWATALARRRAGTESVAVALVTDGYPTVCDRDVEHIAALAADAYASAGVRTYAVGLPGSQPATIDAIAAAGGTERGFYIGQAVVQTALRDALLAIARTQLGCSFAVPAGSRGPIDPDNLQLTLALSGKTTVLPRMDALEDCGDGPGYAGSDPSNPAVLRLCPATCAEAQADPGAKLEVLAGCAVVLR